ncbi:hypothetical protein O6H91_08G094400 [Diphasiastrum complanatum]|uniref:Uncharacterized protein n=1 Tax=Diphasiastrum complanatum TaxID=34168 RepID=A0ACC2CZX5_DIPCM|nr:hypothetical protein O6H91_08G094400 [Diphasiastrum complanatum]
MVETIFAEVELKVPIEQIWKAQVADGPNCMPKIFPAFIESIETLEGDGGAGSVRRINLGSAVPYARYVKEHVDVLNDETHIFTYTVIEGGGLGEIFDYYKATISFKPGADENTTIGRWSLDYSLIGEHPGLPAQLKRRNVDVFKTVEAYLLSGASAQTEKKLHHI